MQILELSLHNYKIHRKLNLKFDSGVVGILGDNGSGKSSIISAICFLFTGEVDTDRKSECLTLGETEGWVRGKFELNGKEGVLERHLNSSQISLTYDGVNYRKASEVNQLWNELLQIDSTIFNNVIVAKQGEIQNLFSDETAVREKIFQKIFMVPPTEKIRNVIWDNYIKVCPPERPEEDAQLLQNSEINAAKKRNQFLKSIEDRTNELAGDVMLRSINDRIRFLNKCEEDLKNSPKLETAKEGYQQEHDNNEVNIKEFETFISASTSVKQLTENLDRLKALKPVYERKLSIQVEIDNLNKTVNEEETNKILQEVDGIDTRKAEALSKINELTIRNKDTVAQKNHLLQLRGHATCPTCGQELPDHESILSELMIRESAIIMELMTANKLHTALSKQSQQLWSEIGKQQSVLQRINYLKEELGKLKEIQFSEVEYASIEKQLKVLNDFLEALQVARNRQLELSAELRVVNEKLNNLARYDGDVSIERELTVLSAAVEANQAIQDEIAGMLLEAGKLEHELELLESRITSSIANHEYNLKRKEYITQLEAVHDLFNVSKFPRKLIEAYMASVQASLATYLNYFNVPYSVRVEDGFKIKLYTPENRPLPTVSGGQQMMVGMSLRLALHKMFAQSFSIWIIDEGTTHLDTANRQNYFELIDELRIQKVIKQIIIIDHDEKLSDVVDQIIELS